ncbi:MAG: type II toxin-antitoxin system RelB family antitoxin [Rhodoferax sp.]
MNAALSPIVSEFETEAAAVSYDEWFRAKVKEALNDQRPSIPHDEAVARIDKLLAEKREKRAVG